MKKKKKRYKRSWEKNIDKIFSSETSAAAASFAYHLCIFDRRHFCRFFCHLLFSSWHVVCTQHDFFSICIPYNDSSFLLQPHCGKIAIFNFKNLLIFAPKLDQKCFKILIFASGRSDFIYYKVWIFVPKMSSGSLLLNFRILINGQAIIVEFGAYMSYSLGKMNCLFTFLCIRSIARCIPTARISFLAKAWVKYKWRSRNLPLVLEKSECSSSCCSASISDKRFKNHSKDFWSRLIQMKSTLRKLCICCAKSVIHRNWQRGHSRLEKR